MSAGSWLPTAVGCFAIVAGAAVLLLGLLLLAAIFSGRGVPVSGAGLFVVLTLGAGPLLTLAGALIIVSGIKLMGGHVWARTVLDIFSWVALFASSGWLVYSATQQRHIHAYHVVQGAMFFLVTGVPAIVMILLLRSDALHRAMTR